VSQTANHPRRIVITGMGLVSPLGASVNAAWTNLLAARSGIRALDADMIGEVTSRIAGVVPSASEPDGFDESRVITSKDAKKVDRFITLALAAAAEAVEQAQWKPETEEQRARTATVIASSMGGFLNISDAVRTTYDAGPRRLSPFTVPSFLPNMAAGWVSIRHGFKGPLGAPGTACAASLQAIGDAARIIRAGEADVAVCGGTEAALNLVGIGAFAAARALSTAFNDRPTEASRPFDTERDGFVIAEGAGVLVIESLEHALARGATPIAEIVGYGTAADAYHITAGPENGDGAARSMRAALLQAQLAPERIGHVNAHATSTPVGDKAELAAMRAVFGTNPHTAISATKSATGHTLGAAGGVEAIFTALALRDQMLPPTLNLTNPDPATEGLNVVGPTARPWEFEYALSNGFGFGGVNASVVLRRWTGA
jgi:3-oxoacyl-[acyl-carrier-protein] synthase II